MCIVSCVLLYFQNTFILDVVPYTMLLQKKENAGELEEQYEGSIHSYDNQGRQKLYRGK